jgi:hypothetical protein
MRVPAVPSSQRLVGALILSFLALPNAAIAETPKGSTSPSAATTPAGNQTEAQKVYIEGIALREKGDVQGALTKFERAHELYPTPVTSLEHAKTLMTVGRYAEARELLLPIPSMPVGKTESDKSKRAREEAKTLAIDVLERMAEYSVSYIYKDGKPCIDECQKIELLFDGKPATQNTTGRKVDPRKHVITAKKGAWSKSEEVTLREREKRAVEFMFEPEAAKRPGENELPPRRPGMNAMAWTGLVGAIAFGIGGGVAGGAALHFKGEANKCIKGDARCANTQGLIDNANLTATLSTVGLIASGAFLVVGAVAFFTLGPREVREPAVDGASKKTTSKVPRFKLAPTVGFGGLGVVGEFH